jgi:hypothetical protein
MAKLEGKNIAIIISIVALLVSVSGWATFIYSIVTSTPKISGQIFNIIIGQMQNPNNSNQQLTSFIVYLYITNERNKSVHILDYEMEVDSGTGFEKVLRVYGVQNVQNWHFESNENLIEIPDFNSKLIYAQNKALDYGSPLHGFVVFASTKPQQSFISNGSSNKYRITIIDAFQKKHYIVSSADKFPNLYLLQDLAGMKITPRNK